MDGDHTAMTFVRPPALQEGDCIGLAAPASAFKAADLVQGVAVLRHLGFRVTYTPRVFESYRYLAGSDAARAAELTPCLPIQR